MSDAELISQECDKVKSLLLEKNKNYGGSALEPKRIFSKADSVEQIKVRIDDKLSRIQTLGIDSLQSEDTLLDLIGYLILLRIANAKKVGTSIPLDELKAKWEEAKDLSKMIQDIPKAIPYADKIAKAKFVRNLEKQFEEQIVTAPSPLTVAEMDKNFLEMENYLGTDEDLAKASEDLQKVAPYRSKVSELKAKWKEQRSLLEQQHYKEQHEQKEKEAAYELKEKQENFSRIERLLGTDEAIAKAIEDMQKKAAYEAKALKEKERATVAVEGEFARVTFEAEKRQTEEFTESLKNSLSEERQEERKQEKEKTLSILQKIYPIIPQKPRLSEFRKGIIIRRAQGRKLKKMLTKTLQKNNETSQSKR